MIQFPRDSLSVPAVPHLQGTSSFITAIYAQRHRRGDHDTLGHSFFYSQDFSHSPCIKTFQRSQLGFLSQVYLHLVNLYDKQITIKKVFCHKIILETSGTSGQESSSDLTANLLAQGVSML